MPTTADSVAVADTLGTVEMPAVGQGAIVRQNAGALGALGPFGRLSPRMLAMIAGAALIAVVAAAMLWSRTPNYGVLYSNVADSDGGAIIAALQQMNVPYRFADGGSAIMVPEANVHEARLKLAAQGLPKGGLAGFELMENQKFGTSQFAEQVNYQRALEGELARTIQAMQEVQSARVHLALSKPSVFVREQAKPSASVLLKLYPGRMLDRSQVQAIGHLVSSSVPNLPLANVTVVDQSGRLLSSSFQDNASGLDPTQLNYVRDIEQGYIKRIEAILGPVLGEDNVRAQVTADVDLDNTEQMAETYRPNQDPSNGVVRSTHTSESTQNKAGAQGGVPGALSNQPPSAPRMLPTAPAPASQQAAAGQNGQNGQNGQQQAAAATGQTAANGVESSARDTTINYEVDKTVRRTRAAVGTVRRLSVAVVVNYRADGKAWKPLSDAEMVKLNALVKDAVGYDAKRGDSVNVVNSQFSGTLPVAKDDLPLWKQPEMIHYAIQAAKYGALAIGFLILVFAVIRPLIRSMNKKDEHAAATFVGREGEDPNAPIITGAAAPAGPELEGPSAASAQGDEVQIEVPQLKMNHDFEQKLETMRRIAQQNPRAVAAVVKQWVSSE
ncbi:flagellar basal-body MS-ring/collar protein FliF [Ralstonia syzygii subsp. celebesensis]|uniref:Flagellar M-ring protein n=3 Tax=Ralstonia solanacearum species complex TaxID=3116862 RepID=A0AAD0WIS6_RALSL|nr:MULTISPECIES: flagellar basal-body MS-ring/collar protein FliF [Ralstonia solanacearum species complex]CCA81658.1 flagellar biosynthesis protein, M-ring protein, Belongs to the fliF family [blood disease bacterium R229]AQW30985.1 flagellar M-ring protein FliF [blood disease bacterium A2-HR MARDI]AXV83522.1 flagellar basal body M-ring protein FliF [Ralstonia solanacearum]AXW54655.1 flagellar basal body M-ring protein FliF [Ralstonia solanacearum]QQV55213.1 flagellar M-ring protein FliF [Rals